MNEQKHSVVDDRYMHIVKCFGISLIALTAAGCDQDIGCSTTDAKQLIASLAYKQAYINPDAPQYKEISSNFEDIRTLDQTDLRRTCAAKMTIKVVYTDEAIDDAIKRTSDSRIKDTFFNMLIDIDLQYELSRTDDNKLYGQIVRFDMHPARPLGK